MDIVDGLRLVAGAPTDRLDCFNCHSRMREAADEITRLRAELEASETELRIVRASQAESNAEVERLRADIERHIAIASEHATECERLRAELAECKRDNERLHVAMCQSCVCLNNGETYRGHQIIRAALAEEETR